MAPAERCGRSPIHVHRGYWRRGASCSRPDRSLPGPNAAELLFPAAAAVVSRLTRLSLCSSKWRTTPVLREVQERPEGASAADSGPGCGAAGAAAVGAEGEAAGLVEARPKIRK